MDTLVYGFLTMTSMRDTLLIKNKTDFDQQHLGADGLVETQMF